MSESKSDVVVFARLCIWQRIIDCCLASNGAGMETHTQHSRSFVLLLLQINGANDFKTMARILWFLLLSVGWSTRPTQDRRNERKTSGKKRLNRSMFNRCRVYATFKHNHHHWFWIPKSQFTQSPCLSLFIYPLCLSGDAAASFVFLHLDCVCFYLRAHCNAFEENVAQSVCLCFGWAWCWLFSLLFFAFPKSKFKTKLLFYFILFHCKRYNNYFLRKTHSPVGWVGDCRYWKSESANTVHRRCTIHVQLLICFHGFAHFAEHSDFSCYSNPFRSGGISYNAWKWCCRHIQIATSDSHARNQNFEHMINIRMGLCEVWTVARKKVIVHVHGTI